MKDPEKSLTLIAAGLGFLYFGWLYSATGIYSNARGRVATAVDDPDRFSLAVGLVFVFGIASLIAGVVTMLRR